MCTVLCLYLHLTLCAALPCPRIRLLHQPSGYDVRRHRRFSRRGRVTSTMLRRVLCRVLWDRGAHTGPSAGCDCGQGNVGGLDLGGQGRPTRLGLHGLSFDARAVCTIGVLRKARVQCSTPRGAPQCCGGAVLWGLLMLGWHSPGSVLEAVRMRLGWYGCGAPGGVPSWCVWGAG